MSNSAAPLTAQRSTPDVPLAQHARELHEQVAGRPPVEVATAPGTWLVAGEHTDQFGGYVIIGQCDLRTAAAVSPRPDHTIAVTLHHREAGLDDLRHETTLEELGALAAAQQPGVDEAGQPVIPPAPEGHLGVRAAGLVWSLVGRQVLSRETTGYDITVVTDIPPHAGLGGPAAMDAAIALALAGAPEPGKEAPQRARLAEICGQAVALFSELPTWRARHTAALRGEGESLTVIDYADNSVSHAPHALGKEMAGFVVTVPGVTDHAASVALIRRHQRFIAEVSQAFGTDNVRLLPDASTRVLAWLEAVHQVNGPAGKPTLEEARDWLLFLQEETARSTQVARALRSRSGLTLADTLHASQLGLRAQLGLPAADELVELVKARGASAARAAAAGSSRAVVAYVPPQRAVNFVADLRADGLEVFSLHPGHPACLERARG